MLRPASLAHTLAYNFGLLETNDKFLKEKSVRVTLLFKSFGLVRFFLNKSLMLSKAAFI